MNEFVLVVIIASVAALLTFLGAPAAEKFESPYWMVSAALQFAGGIIAALVAFSLMPPAAGFFITTVTQSIIPEANREGEPSFAGILFVGGL